MQLQTNVFNVDYPQQTIVQNVEINDHQPNAKTAKSSVTNARKGLLAAVAAAQNQEPVNLHHSSIRS